MESAKDEECNSAKKLAEESMSCISKAMSAEAEEEQGASGEADMQNNSKKGTKRKRSMKNDDATCPKKMLQCCGSMQPQKMQIPPLPSVLPPANLIHRDVLRAWCQQLKLSTKGRKLDGYKRLCEYAYPNQKDFPASPEEARILSASRRKLMMDKWELLLEASDKKMSFGGAATTGVGAPALEGAIAHEAVVSTSADTEDVFASWNRIVAKARKVEAVESRDTCEVKWCVVHGRSLPGNTEGWVRLQFHAGQAWVPEKRRRVSALFLLPANTFPPPYLEDNMLCPECVQRLSVPLDLAWEGAPMEEEEEEEEEEEDGKMPISLDSETCAPQTWLPGTHLLTPLQLSRNHVGLHPKLSVGLLGTHYGVMMTEHQMCGTTGRG